jgi:hypothetical protein
MNAPVPRSAVCVDDPLAVFEMQCARWATAYAQGRASLHRAVDALEAMTPLDLDVDPAQAIIAGAIETAEQRAAALLALTTAPVEADDPDDDYAGLSHSFARLCRVADAKIANRPELEDIPPGTATAARLEREYERSLIRAHARDVPKSTLEAADYLVREGDPKRLDAWLAGYSAVECAAILDHVKHKKGKP